VRRRPARGGQRVGRRATSSALGLCGCLRLPAARADDTCTSAPDLRLSTRARTSARQDGHRRVRLQGEELAEMKRAQGTLREADWSE
jgi:hypothetical protein